MSFISSKISLEKSWRFTPDVVILIILGIIVMAGLFILTWNLENTIFIPPTFVLEKPKILEGNVQIPTGPIYAIWGTITSIDTTFLDRGPFKIEEGTITLKSGLGEKYVFKVNDETAITKYLMGSEEGPPKLLEEHFYWKELKVGDYIYFESPEDLLTVHEPKGVGRVELYVTK